MSNTLPIKKAYEGSVCEIKSMDNELIAIGRIKEITTEYIKIMSDKKELNMVDYGTPVKINLFNARIGFRVLVGSVYTSTRMEMTLNSVYNLVDKERRNFFRVDMYIPARILYSKSPRDEFMTEDSIIILDMSLSGLKFKTNSVFEMDSTFTIELKLNPKKKSVFQCKIIREIETKDNHNCYGSEFVYSKSEDADMLCSYLFKKQREFLNKRDN